MCVCVCVCARAHARLYPSPVSGPLGCFHVLVIMNSGAMNITPLLQVEKPSLIKAKITCSISFGSKLRVIKSINPFYLKAKAPATSAEVLSHQEGGAINHHAAGRRGGRELVFKRSIGNRSRCHAFWPLCFLIAHVAEVPSPVLHSRPVSLQHLGDFSSRSQGTAVSAVTFKGHESIY